MCLFMLSEVDKRICIYKSSNINLRRNNLSPFQKFHCFKIQKQDYNKVSNYEEDKSNLISFSTQTAGFVCDKELWRNVIIIKMVNSTGKNMPSTAIAHNVLYKLGLGNF